MPKFPFTNYHELNLDWILKKVNALFDASEENAQTIRTYNTRLTAAEQTATNANTAATAAQQLAYAASENADDALAVAGTADSKADSAMTAATTAVGAAAGAMTTAQEARQIAGSAQSAAADAGAVANDASNAAAAAQQTADTNAGNIANLQTAVDTLSSSVTEIDNKADVIIDSASGSIASFADGANDMPIRSLVVNIEPVQAGSGDPSPTNVRPITGHTECKVTRTGVNVWDEEVESGYIDPINGQETPAANKIRMKNYVPVLPNTTYYKRSNFSFWIVYYDKNKQFIRYGNAATNITFTTPGNCYYIRSGLEADYGTTYNNDISINYPATDTEYHPYTGNQISVTFPSSAGTVYGGTLDVTNGVLTVDRAIVDLGTLTWDTGSTYISGKTRYRADVNGIKRTDSTSSLPPVVCSQYTAATLNNTYNCIQGVSVDTVTDRIWIYDEQKYDLTKE